MSLSADQGKSGKLPNTVYLEVLLISGIGKDGIGYHATASGLPYARRFRYGSTIEIVTTSNETVFTCVYCGQVHNIHNYTKQHLHIYTCTRVYIIYMYICKRDYVTFFIFLHIFEPDSVCGWKMLKSIKRRVSGIGKDL